MSDRVKALYQFTYAAIEEGERLAPGREDDARNVLASSLEDALTKARKWIEHDSPAEHRPDIAIEVLSVRLVGVVDWPLERPCRG